MDISGSMEAASTRATSTDAEKATPWASQLEEITANAPKADEKYHDNKTEADKLCSSAKDPAYLAELRWSPHEVDDYVDFRVDNLVSEARMERGSYCQSTCPVYIGFRIRGFESVQARTWDAGCKTCINTRCRV
jgi:hypothetical protein